MAKKKKPVKEIKDVSYKTEDGALVKVIKFNPEKMSVDINIHVEGKKVESKSIAFAHLPKNIKKIIKG